MKTLRKWAETCIRGVTWQQLALIVLGTAVLSFGVHNIHQRAGVTEGGVIGMILLLHQHLGWSAAILSPLLDVICYGLAWRQLGVGFIRLSVFSTLCLAGFYRLWELFPPLLPDLSAHPLWAAVLGGVLVGLGAGLVVSQGGSCGGDDALALSIARVTRWRLSAAYLVTDLTVLALICTPTVLKPESTYSTSPVMRLERSDARNTAELPTSSMVTFSRIGDISAKCLYISRKPPTPAAANVRIGPAEIAFTRIFCGPRSYAKYLVDDSSAALATPITL